MTNRLLNNNSDVSLYCSLFYVFCAIVIGNGEIITIISKLLLTGTAILLLINNRQHPVISTVFYKWNIVVLILFSCSLFWTAKWESSTYILSTFAFVVICNISLFYLLSANSENVTKTMNYIILFAILMAIRGFIAFGSLAVPEDRGDLNDIGFNLNTLGMNCAIAGLFALYFYRKANFRRKARYLAAMLVCLVIIIISGSKKALLIPLIALLIMKLCHTKKRYLLFNLVLISCALFGAYYLIMNVPFLYDNIGIRMEGMINGFTGTGEVDASTYTRLKFIDFGMYIIPKNLWTGYGLGTYEYLFNQTFPGWGASYSHNNYIELLVGVGLIGTIVYYSIYIYLICALVSIIRKTKDELSILLLAILIGLIFGHYGLVAYYNLTQNILLTLISVKTLQIKRQLSIVKNNRHD